MKTRLRHRAIVRATSVLAFEPYCPIAVLRYIHANPKNLEYPPAVKARVEQMKFGKPTPLRTRTATVTPYTYRNRRQPTPSPIAVTTTPSSPESPTLPTPHEKAVDALLRASNTVRNNLDPDGWHLTSLTFPSPHSPAAFTATYEKVNASGGETQATISQHITPHNPNGTYTWFTRTRPHETHTSASTLLEAQILASSALSVETFPYYNTQLAER